MTRRFFVFCFILSIFFTFSSINILHAQSYNYQLDIPEGFEMIDQDADGKGFMFYNQLSSTFCVIRIASEYRNATEALSTLLKKMGANGSVKTYRWQYKDCAITGSLSCQINGAMQVGRAAAIPLTDAKNIIIAICFGANTPVSKAVCDSIIDSISVDRGTLFSVGIVTSFNYPAIERKDISLTIANKSISTSIDGNAEKAEKSVIDREFEIMKLYINSPKWKEAWIRYYQQLYRVSYYYLQRVSFDVATVLYENDTQFARTILQWLQYFSYERSNSDDADFTPTTTAIQYHKNDCDSRSITLAAILNQCAIPTTVFVSREYSHMMAGINLKDAGLKIQGSDRAWYLTAETTSKGLSLGMMAAEMADRSKWIDCALPR